MSRKPGKPQSRKSPLAQRSATVAAAGTAPGAARRGLCREWGYALLVFAAVFIAYQQVWHAGFVWDDDAHLTANPCIIGPLGFTAIWTSSAAVYYPLVLTSFWVQHALWGLNPLPYHLVNLAMHAACAVLLWRVLLALRVRGGWLGALLWALHPVMVESAAWITELKNTQSCFFYLLTILCFLRWAKEGGYRFYGLALFCATLAILSKSSTVMLPVVLGLCVWWTQAGLSWRTVARLIPFLLVSLLAGGWTIWEQKFHSGALGNSWQQSWPDRLVIAGDAIWFYLGKLAWPHPLIFVYPRWHIDSSRWLAWLPAIAAAAALLLLWRGRNGRLRPFFFTAAYFVVSLFPVLGFFSVYYFRYSFVADHFQYLASIGPIALAGAAAVSLMDRLPGDARLLRPAIAAALILPPGILTWEQCRMYSDMETLWRTTLARNPGCWLAANDLGLIFAQQGKTEEAAAQYAEALRLNPDYPEAHVNLGIFDYQQGRTADAITQYREALLWDPRSGEAHNDLGVALAGMGKPEDAILEFREALRNNPDYSDAHANLADALLKTGQLTDAIAEKQKVISSRPGDVAALMDLAALLVATPGVSPDAGSRAVQLAARAAELSKDDPTILRTLAAAYAEAGQFPEAVDTARAALQLAQSQSNSSLAGALPGDIKLYEQGQPLVQAH